MSVLDFAFELLFILMAVLVFLIGIVFLGAVLALIIFAGVGLTGWILSMSQGEWSN